MATGSTTRKRGSSGSGNLKNKGNTGKRRNTGTNRSRRRSSSDEMITNEIVLIAVIAIAALLFLSNLGAIGKLGKSISDVMYGLFGIVSYLVPVIMVAAAVLYVKNKGAEFNSVKTGAGIVMILVLCSFAQLLLFPDDVKVSSAGDYYDRCKELKAGGGAIGGLITSFLNKGTGKVGTYIVLIVLAIIALILITERSLFEEVRKGSLTLYDNARSDLERRRERRENERPLREEHKRILKEEREARRQRDDEIRRQKVEEREARLKQRDVERLKRRMEDERMRRENLLKKEEGALRVERKVSGVMLDTRLSSADETQSPINDDIHEISLNKPAVEIIDNDKKSGADTSGDINEVFYDSMKNEYRLGYENARSAHSIAVDVKGTTLKNNTGDKLARKLSDTEELERSIINEAIHLSNEHDYAGPVTRVESIVTYADDPVKDRMSGSSSRKEGNGYSLNRTSIDEYKMPSVNIDEGSYEAGTSARTAAESTGRRMPAKEAKVFKDFKYPPVNLLKKGNRNATGDSRKLLDEKAKRLKDTLKEFGVSVTMEGYTQGPAITRFEMKPDVGVKVSKVLNLSDDIMLSMAAKNVRIEAPIPGKSLIGIELPNEENTAVMFRDLIESEEFKKSDSRLSFAVGKGLSGETVVTDIGKMPHLLIAGATGSGKSVCINTLIMSILYKAAPDEVKLIMIDPKVVELSVYNGIPHLMIPVVTDPKQAAEALKWGVAEMDDRYNKFAEFQVRDLNGYNKKVLSMTDVPEEDRYSVLPRIIIIVDELADLMMVASKEVEESICRIAQKARAAGIHLVIATQRPSVDVVTGLIKANMPSRIAFSVSSGVDSRTILDMVGAEKLLGKGDMLFYPQGYTKPARVQGAFVSDQEVNNVVDFLKEHCGQDGYDEKIANRIKNGSVQGTESPDRGQMSSGTNDGRDELFEEAARAIIDKNKASIGMLQRLFKIGFNRAARIMDQLADAGVVGEEEGTKPRKVLMTLEEFENEF